MAPKTVLITGCSAGGIGFELARAFQKQGLHVFATARSLSKLSELKTLPNVTLFTLDVVSSDSIAAAVEEVKAKTGGKLDYLINNAGMNYYMPALDMRIEEAKRMFDVNFWSVFEMMRAFAPLMIAAKGTIVNIGSVNGYTPLPFTSKCLHAITAPFLLHGAHDLRNKKVCIALPRPPWLCWAIQCAWSWRPSVSRS